MCPAQRAVNAVFLIVVITLYSNISRHATNNYVFLIRECTVSDGSATVTSVVEAHTAIPNDWLKK